MCRYRSQRDIRHDRAVTSARIRQWARRHRDSGSRRLEQGSRDPNLIFVHGNHRPRFLRTLLGITILVILLTWAEAAGVPAWVLAAASLGLFLLVLVWIGRAFRRGPPYHL